MLPRTVRLTAATIVALGLLTACSGETGGSADPSASPSSSGASSSGSGPKVPAALPTGDLLNNPCNVLNASEAAKEGLMFPGRTVNESSVSCSFKSTGNPLNSVSIGALPQNKNGISDIYDQKAQSAYFEPVTVNGYPGVLADAHDGRPSGNCQLWLGVTDELAVSIIPQISAGQHKADPCGFAQEVAGVVVDHLKAAA
ncbi:DUF3558 domain-containing protein [Amycolatopsis sp. NPDC051372]|uniref:DUF3558 domain-containing protein n=1 Tax=unclassified Amycolatopsis TaxID=2618356 RepID=UPI00341A4BDC